VFEFGSCREDVVFYENVELNRLGERDMSSHEFVFFGSTCDTFKWSVPGKLRNM